MSIRKAFPSEADALTALALRSKAVWRYDEHQLHLYRDQLEVFAEDIEAGWTFVGESDGRLRGFYALSANSESARLDFLFVEPADIGKGIGKALWRHALETSRVRGWTRIAFYADRYAAEKFYRHQDCRVIGSRPSGLGELLELQFDFD